MTTANRKMMKSMRYKSLEEINDKILIEILQNAYEIRDKKFWKWIKNLNYYDLE